MATRARVNSALRAQHMPPHLRHLEGKFKNSRGQSLSYLALFPPAKSPLRAVVVYLHGIGDHSRRYFYLYEQLCNAGFGVFAYDLLSHGASDSDHHGLRAHGAKFHYFVDDTNEFITMAKTELYPKLSLSMNNEPKMVLSGMSYGTLVSLHTILSGKHAFSGVVLVAPALLVEMTAILRVQAVFARPLSKLVPKARIVPAVNADFLCRDQDYLDDFKADPLTVSEPVTARMGAESLKAMKALEADKRIEDKSSDLCKLPILMMMGSNDKVTSLELAQMFYNRLASSDKEFKVFDEYFHALFDDPERDAVFAHLDNWLKTRFPLPEEAKIDKIDEDIETKAEVTTEPNVEVAAVLEGEQKVEAAVVVEEVKVETTETSKETTVTEEINVEVTAAQEPMADAAQAEKTETKTEEAQAVEKTTSLKE
ncbi:putative abhydrolase domain-containing protein [Phytophthora nicotianae]|uniref:Abhydrolase domain-containing protein n=1 Tax=Phytophthora nicotianae TaxID=4792 RepID=A0A0W8D050_PHYNI|nr:Pre-mRNA-splicing factor SF2 [Phytophthora nicotianae]KUG01856.1 putative abhydrolase domain-containing protein [Phytophthora nicotianae]